MQLKSTAELVTKDTVQQSFCRPLWTWPNLMLRVSYQSTTIPIAQQITNHKTAVRTSQSCRVYVHEHIFGRKDIAALCLLSYSRH